MEAAIGAGIGFAIGAVAYVIGLAALVRFVTRRITRSSSLNRRVAAASYLVAWALTVPIAAYGFADGGPPQWIFALTAYLPTAFVGFWATLNQSTGSPAG